MCVAQKEVIMKRISVFFLVVFMLLGLSGCYVMPYAPCQTGYIAPQPVYVAPSAYSPVYGYAPYGVYGTPYVAYTPGVYVGPFFGVRIGGGGGHHHR